MTRRLRNRTVHDDEEEEEVDEAIDQTNVVRQNDQEDDYEMGDNNDESNSSNEKKKGKHDRNDDDESFHESEDALEVSDDDDDDDDNLNPKDSDYESGYYRNSRRKRSSYRNSEARSRYNRRREEQNFVVSDPDDEEQSESEEGFRSYTSRRRNLRRSSRSNKRSLRNQNPNTPTKRNLRPRTRLNAYMLDEDNHSETNTGDLSLKDELRELQNDSPIYEKRSLRERTKPVNYTLPPPILEPQQQLQNDFFATNSNNAWPNPSPKRNKQNMGPARRLFPTGGPFGGNDVTTIFGRNTNFYNQDVGGNFNSLKPRLNPDDPNNKRLIDSDSSEDEILPLGTKPKEKSAASKNKKKKPEIADLDPLGVDMNINFDEIGGLDNYIDQLKEMVTLPLLYPELYQNFSITPPRGVLFHGPPGTGKTLMARALAASCSSSTQKITFFMRKGADILSKWVGEAERQLRLLFEEAKKQQPSIIFFDEIDGLAPVRSSKQEQIHASIVSTMLALMDGMDNRGQVIIIGATNRPDAVDPALRRPGRFDREFYFPLPDMNARSKILQIHTKKWKSPLPTSLIEHLAYLTEGFGGADLRSLCTEAALISIQHSYPQIYRSKDKLTVDPSSIRVKSSDFMLALKKIVPSSARSTGSTSQFLPEQVKPLLNNQYDSIKQKLEVIFPTKNQDPLTDKSKSLIEYFTEYEDYDEVNDDELAGFGKYSVINNIADSLVCRPSVLISGPIGNGQQYIGSAILHYFENINVQNLDLATLLSQSTQTMESTLIQYFLEAKKRQPSVLFIPNLDIWSRTVPEQVILTLASLLRSLKNSEKVLLLGIAENLNENDIEQTSLVHLNLSKSIININKPTLEQKSAYFKQLFGLLSLPPTSLKMGKKRVNPLPVLPPVKPESDPKNLDENGQLLSPTDIIRRDLQKFQYQDMRLKNVLKIKLSGLMDLFKNRYKRFRKPPIDDAYLIHLFEPPQIANVNWQPLYVKEGDMILEVSTGKKYFNMDLDIIEERLWNGFYSEPRQFLKDVELIYADSNTTGDRERIMKSSEMYANAQMGIEDISTKELVDECKALRKRDMKRQELFLKDEEERLEKEEEERKKALVAEGTVGSEVVQSTENVQDSGNTIATDKTVGAEAVTNPDPETAIVNNQIDYNGSLQTNPLHADYNNDAKTIGEHSMETPKNVEELGVGAGSQMQAQLISNDKAEMNMSKQFLINIGTAVRSTNEKNVDLGLVEPNFTDRSAYSQKSGNQATNEADATVTDATVADTSGKNGINSLNETVPNIPEVVAAEEPKKDVKVDLIVIEKLINELCQKTSSHTVSQLENVYSKLVRIIWNQRLDWDKTKAVEKIAKFIDTLN